MNTKYRVLLLSVCLSAVVTGCSTTLEKTAEQAPVAVTTLVNDYPTRDRVEYVLNCVAQHGGLTYITQYACGCKIDKIAEKMSFTEFESAKTFTYLSKGQTGDAGAVFRDPAQSKDLRTRLKEAEASAEKSCFVK
jgi:aminopeptidase-like protein